MAPGGRRGGGQRGRRAGADGRAQSAQSGAAPPRRVRAGAGARGGHAGGMRPLTALYIECPRSEPSARRRGGEERGAGVGPCGAPRRGRRLSALSRGARWGCCGGARPLRGGTHTRMGVHGHAGCLRVCFRCRASRVSQWTDPSPLLGEGKIPPGLVPPVFAQGGAYRSLCLRAKRDLGLLPAHISLSLAFPSRAWDFPNV